MKKKLSLLLCVVLTLPLLLSGCTPYKELKELAIVEGFGIDKKPDGSYLLTFQILDSSGGGGGEGGGKQASSNKTTVIQSTGKSLFDASRNVTKQMGKKLFYSNNRALIIGKSVCANSFSELLDFLERNHEFAPTERLFMAEGRAENMLLAKNEKGFISAEDIELIAENSYNTSMVLDETLNDIEKNVSSESTDVCLPVLSIQKAKSSGSSGSSSSSSSSSSGGNDIVTINSTAVLSENKLSGILNSNETRGIMWIREKEDVQSGVIVVEPAEGGTASMEILGNSSKISAISQDGKPGINVDITFTTRLAEAEIDQYTMDQKFIDELMTLQNQSVKDEAEAALSAALKKYKSDVFGFGEKIYQTKPQLWKDVSMDWTQNLSMLPVQITVQSTVEDNGQINK